MAVDRSYIAENTTERERLRTLVNRLSEADLRRPLSAGWTVAGVLGHLAFWDQRTLILIERWERAGAGRTPSPINREDVDWINDSAKALCLELAPRAAAQLALVTAEAVDRKLEALPDDFVAANQAAGTPLNPLRAQHRRTHLEEIGRALKG